MSQSKKKPIHKRIFGKNKTSNSDMSVPVSEPSSKRSSLMGAVVLNSSPTPVRGSLELPEIHSTRESNHILPKISLPHMKSKPKLVEDGSDTSVKSRRDSVASKKQTENSGFLSSFLAVAHSAATQLTSKEKNDEEENAAADDPGSDDMMPRSTSFLQHLDFLLSDGVRIDPMSPVKPAESGTEVMKTPVMSSQVQFQPLKDSHISTLGRGSLTLQDLGLFPEENTSMNDSVNKGRPLSADVAPIDSGLKTSTPEMKRPRSTSYANISREGSARGRSVRKLTSTAVQKALSPAGKREDTNRLQVTKKPSVESFTSADHSIAISDMNGVDSSVISNVKIASEKRNAEFHAMFSDIPDFDNLLTDYSCALSRDILLQGRMYISEKHISFNSTILRWVTNVIIPFKEIVQIEKKSTAGMFPNGLVIHTLHAKYIFASFISRDTTFDFITEVWNQTIGGAPSILPNRQSVTSKQTESPSSVSDEGVEEDDDADDDTDLTDMTDSDGEVDGLVNHGPEKHAPTDPDLQLSSRDTKISEVILNAPLGRVYDILFGDDTSYVETIAKKQGNYDFTSIPKFEDKKREYTYTKPLSGPIGPSKTKCIISETIEFCDFEKYVLATQVSKTPDVPSGNAFSVKTSFYLSWGDNNATKLTVVVCVDWTAKSWIKGPVEKGTIDGVTASTKKLVEEVKIFLSGGGKARKESVDDGVVSTLPTTGPATHEPTDFGYIKDNRDFVCIESILPAPLGTIYSVLCGDDSSYLKDIIKKQKNIEISDIPKFANDSREYNYIKPLNAPVGPKQTKCLITETIDSKDFNNNVCIKQVTRTPDVPSGGSFSVNTRIYLAWGDNNCTKIFVVGRMEWTGRSLLKGPIEKGSIDGQKESTKILVEELKSLIESNKTGGKRKRAKTRVDVPVVTTESTPSEVPSSGTFGMVMDLVSGFGITNIMIGLILVLLSILFMRPSGGTSFHMTPIGSQISLNGQSYHLIPSLDTLYAEHAQTYRRRRPNLVDESEFDLWEWVENRSDFGSHSSLNSKKGGHSKQQLAEIIRLAEERIQLLKKELEDSH